MSELAHEATPYSVVEEEPPELLSANLRAAAHLLSGATAFFFVSFVFAYFYLRSVNSFGMWRPKHVDPSTAWGTLSMAGVVVMAVFVRLGLADHRAARRAQWRSKGAVALLGGILAIVFQIIEWTQQSFGPTNGAYASVFVAWTGFYLLFVLGTVYWIQTVLATSFRYRKVPHGAPEPGEASGDPYRTRSDIRDPLSLVRPGLESLSLYATFIAAVGVLTWVVLYLL